MPQAFLTHIHHGLINATVEELTIPNERVYLFDTGGKPIFFRNGENYLARNGNVFCSGVSGSKLHRFEPAETDSIAEEAEFAAIWFEQMKDSAAPGNFISSYEISTPRSENHIYALAPKDREAVEKALLAWPLNLYVREGGSPDLTLVEPGDFLLFSPDEWIQLPEQPQFLLNEALRFWLSRQT